MYTICSTVLGALEHTDIAIWHPLPTLQFICATLTHEI